MGALLTGILAAIGGLVARAGKNGWGKRD
jgi:hypothetical protein